MGVSVRRRKTMIGVIGMFLVFGILGYDLYHTMKR